jgi:signal transduction histidine kinase
MQSYKHRIRLLEFLHRKPGLKITEASEDPEILSDLILNVFDDLMRSKVELNNQVAALQIRNKDLEAYAHMVAHDLKEPLTAMIVTSNLISRLANPTNEELTEYLRQIGLTAYEMNRIVNSMLLLAEVSKADVPVGFVQMARVVENVQERFSYIIRQQSARIILPEAWPDSIGYEPWVEEVWANYLSNAIKYGGRPPHVELGASTQSDGKLRFWTRDNGIGIPPESRKRLFTPFSQLHQNRNSGYGLGLSIVSHIVEKMGGQVGVESELGKGSLFFFTLPAAPSNPALQPSLQN